jgi:hypothetical protein
MRKYLRPVGIGALIGAMAAGLLALPSTLPAAVADEEPVRSILMSADSLFPKRVDGSEFVKPEWTVEPWVSTEVISQSTVKKIGYGRTAYVTITRTATGTYSSDGLSSPHIRYPGIELADGQPWRSFVYVPFEGGAMKVRPHSTCVQTDFGFHC